MEGKIFFSVICLFVLASSEAGASRSREELREMLLEAQQKIIEVMSLLGLIDHEINSGDNCPEIPPPDEGPEIIVTVSGWTVSSADDDDEIVLPTTSTEQACLSACQSNTKCHFASYDNQTKACQGYSELADFFIIRSQRSAVLLKSTDKDFKRMDNQVYDGDSLFVTPGSAGLLVEDPEECRDLCVFFRDCSLAEFQRTPEKRPFNCRLKTINYGSPSGYQPGAVSYVLN